MNFTEIEGDLIALAYEGKFDIIAHGCNCQQVMGAGIAKQIKNEIPEAYLVDLHDTRTPSQRFGDMTVTGDETTLFRVANLYTQYFPGVNLDMTALKLALIKTNMQFKGKHIGLPLIGCGIAGGIWEEVKVVIQECLKDMDVTIVHFKKETA